VKAADLLHRPPGGEEPEKPARWLLKSLAGLPTLSAAILLVREVAWVPQMITIVSRSVFLRPHRRPSPANQPPHGITNDSNDSRSLKTDTKLDFGQFGQCAGARILRGKLIRLRISSLSRLCRDRKEIDSAHILGLDPSLTHSNFGQSRAKVVQRQVLYLGEINDSRHEA
jgi:hypothetical protein